MAITYLVNYDANGNQDVTLEFDSYNEASISGLRYTDAYHGLQWLTFGSVAIEALSTDDINNGYSGYVKIVAQNRSNEDCIVERKRNKSNSKEKFQRIFGSY